MSWACPPLHLLNWNNLWKWKDDMSKKSLKLDSYAWMAENGAIDYGFYFGDADEPVQFHTTIKELVRDTLEAYRVPNGPVLEYHREDMQKLVNSLRAAMNLVQMELNRMGDDSND